VKCEEARTPLPDQSAGYLLLQFSTAAKIASLPASRTIANILQKPCTTSLESFINTTPKGFQCKDCIIAIPTYRTMANILQLILHNVLAMLLQYYASGSVHNGSSCRSNVCEEVSKHNCCHTNTPDIVAIYPGSKDWI
jgi:hypothetical protein